MILTKNKHEYIPLLIIVILGSIRLYLADYLPILGDGAWHAYLVESIVRDGKLSTFTMYPPLFHLEGAILYFFVGMKYKFLPAIVGTFTILLIYLFVKEITNSKPAAIIAAFFTAIHPYHMLYSSIFFIETTIVFFVILVLYCHIKFLKTDRQIWLALTGIFLGISISVKQPAYLLPLPLLFQHIFFRLYTKHSYIVLKTSIKEYLKIVSISVIIFIFPLLYFYGITGTIFDPTNPYTNYGPFESKLKIDAESVELIYQSGMFKYAHFKPFTFSSDIIEFFNPSTYYYNIFHYPENIFIIFTILGSLYLLLRRRAFFLYILIFISLYYLGLIFTQTPRHFIVLMLLILIPFAYFILTPKIIRCRKYFNSLILSIILIIAIIPGTGLYTYGIDDAKSMYYSMGWLRTEEPTTNLIEAYTFIKENSESEDVVADPNIYEALYYTNRSVFWLRPWGGVDFYKGIYYHDEEKLSKSLKDNRVRYLVIIHRFITKGELNTIQFIRYEDYLFIKNSSLFNLSFEKPGVEVYEFVDHHKKY